MIAWVVMNRHQPRQARRPASAGSYPFRLTSSAFQRGDVQTCQHSSFGTHLSLIPEKTVPFFSCTYAEPILHPLCFQIHAWNGGVYPPSTKKGTTHEHYNR